MIDMKQNLDFHETFNRNNMRILNELSHSRDGESPLSFSDLIDRGTFDLELAAWLMSHVSRGASFIVGAGPGGVGKTTTMRSLLSLAPVNSLLELHYQKRLPTHILFHIASYHTNSAIIAHRVTFGDRISANSLIYQNKVIC